MTATKNDPWLIEAIWRSADLTQAYLVQDRVQVAVCLEGMDTVRLERVLMWLVLEHDALFDELGEPSMLVRQLDAVGALAPPETELTMMAAVHRVAAGEKGLTAALEGLALPDRVHALAVCTVVMLLDALGRTKALEHLDAQAARYEQMGHPRPYTPL
ncbi:hypothetical protein [Streptomyces flavofungini]|uniref:hypothetical protein n=1 Tax=Streptomyces flavofungini TaxID=68200 RepID=UPI0025AF817B|nr:hypothetical protein [Streptomyces flavofungini]WJV51745.1 hypothetical protein QUY26_39650 [Streptomyces flavofungini]